MRPNKSLFLIPTQWITMEYKQWIGSRLPSRERSSLEVYLEKLGLRFEI